jgi:hypothetical protein
LRSILVFLGSVIIAESRVNTREANHNVRVITSDPSLVVHPVNVELFACMSRQVFVMLLEDLVEGHEVDFAEMKMVINEKQQW